MQTTSPSTSPTGSPTGSPATSPAGSVQHDVQPVGQTETSSMSTGSGNPRVSIAEAAGPHFPGYGGHGASPLPVRGYYMLPQYVKPADVQQKASMHMLAGSTTGGITGRYTEAVQHHRQWARVFQPLLSSAAEVEASQQDFNLLWLPLPLNTAEGLRTYTYPVTVWARSLDPKKVLEKASTKAETLEQCRQMFTPPATTDSQVPVAIGRVLSENELLKNELQKHEEVLETLKNIVGCGEDTHDLVQVVQQLKERAEANENNGIESHGASNSEV